MSSPLASLFPSIVTQLSKTYSQIVEKAFMGNEQIASLLSSEEEDIPAKRWYPVLVNLLYLFVVDEAVPFVVPGNQISNCHTPQQQFEKVGSYLRNREAELQKTKGQTLPSDAYVVKYLWLRVNAKVEEKYYAQLLTGYIQAPSIKELVFLSVVLRLTEGHAALLLDGFGYRPPSYRDPHEAVLQYALSKQTGFVSYVRMKSLYRLGRLCSVAQECQKEQNDLQEELANTKIELKDCSEQKEKEIEEQKRSFSEAEKERAAKAEELKKIITLCNNINTPLESVVKKTGNPALIASRLSRRDYQFILREVDKIPHAIEEYLQMLPLENFEEDLDFRQLEILKSDTITLLADLREKLINIQEQPNFEEFFRISMELENARRVIVCPNYERREALKGLPTKAQFKKEKLTVPKHKINTDFGKIIGLEQKVRELDQAISHIAKMDIGSFLERLDAYSNDPLKFFADQHPFGVEGKHELTVLRSSDSLMKRIAKVTYQTSLNASERTREYLQDIANKRIVDDQGHGFTTYMNNLCRRKDIDIKEEVFVEALLAQKQQGQVCRDSSRRTVARLLLKIMETNDCSVKQAVRGALKILMISAVDKKEGEQRYDCLKKLSNIANTNDNDKVEEFLNYMSKHSRGSYIRHLSKVYSIPLEQFSDPGLVESIDSALDQLSHSLYQNKEADKLIYRLLKIFGSRVILQGSGNGIIFKDDLVKLKAPSLQTVVDAILLGHVEASRLFIVTIALCAGEHPCRALEEAKYPAYAANQAEKAIFSAAGRSIDDAIRLLPQLVMEELESSLKNWCSEFDMFIKAQKPLPKFQMNEWAFSAGSLVRDTLSALDITKIPDWSSEERANGRKKKKRELEH